MILVSPAEPSDLITLVGGVTDLLPEEHGADYLFSGKPGLVGVQRKTVSDLLRSLEDGRLAREVALLKRLPVGVLLVEGRADSATDGRLLLPGSRYTKAQLRNLLRSVQGEGLLVERTEGVGDTAAAILEMRDYYRKEVHRSLAVRPKPRTEWGDRTDRDWALHILQGFPGIGPTLAGAIFDRFGEVPLRWACTKRELQSVDGIGKRRADLLWRALNG
jgi:DNA excision repair protein ERCC-4